MSDKLENLLDENNLTIDTNSGKNPKNKNMKNILSQKGKGEQELNDESRNNNIQPKEYLTNNLPSITKPKETDNNETEENLNQNYFYSESNENEPTLKDDITKSAKIIDERKKNILDSLKKRIQYKLIFIYKNEDYYISIKPNCKISDIKEIISKEINLEKDKIILIYKDKEIDDINRNVPVNKFINFSKLKSRPIIYVKKKYVNNINSLNNSDLYKFNLLNYENKIKIINYPTISNSGLTPEEDLFTIVSEFCKNNFISSSFQIEKNDDNPDLVYHTVSFASSDIVFDFNRYFTSLKISNPIFKDTKTVMILSKRKNFKKNNVNNSMENKKLRKRNINEVYEQKRINGEMKRNLLNMNINKYINNSGPYITPYDQYKIDEKENKKKWLNPKGFICSVNKLSGIQI